MDFSVVVPVYNSRDSLPFLFDEIKTYFNNKSITFEVIFVNDGSETRTYEALEALKHNHPEESIRLIHLTKNAGQQKALTIGLRHAQGEYVLTIDDDLQHEIKSLDSLMESADAGADLVFGIYKEYGEKKTRELGSKLIGLFFKMRYKKLKGLRVSSLRLIHRSVYEHLSNRDKKFVYLSAELLPHSKKVGNVVVSRRPRVYGKSGYTLAKCIEIGVKLTLHYGILPLLQVDKKEMKPYETTVNGRRG